MPDQGTDPRCREDGLGWVSRALFGGDRMRVEVTRHPRPDQDGWRTLARYAVVPDVPRARFLLPLGARRVTAASVLAYNALRTPRTRAARWALGQAARAGAAGLAPLPRLLVRVPDDAPDDTDVVHHLAARLGVPGLRAAIGVRPPDPHHKPTVQLFDPAGTPAGYAKVGWNDATRALVAAETAALRALPRVPGYPRVPRLLHAGDWAGRTVAVVDPLPPAVRRVPRPEWPYPEQLLAVARRGGGPGPARPLDSSPYLAGLAGQARRAVSGGCAAAEGAVAAADALATRYSGVRLEFGDWHGDWVPWNLGMHGGGLVAWDWEHHRGDVPVGLDLAHHGFQTALTLDGQPAAEATRAAADALAAHGAVLGLDPLARRAVLDCYLLELWLRTWRLADGGAGWNELLHPRLLDILGTRLATA